MQYGECVRISGILVAICLFLLLQSGVFSPPSGESAEDGTSDLDFGTLRRSSPQVKEDQRK